MMEKGLIGRVLDNDGVWMRALAWRTGLPEQPAPRYESVTALAGAAAARTWKVMDLIWMIFGERFSSAQDADAAALSTPSAGAPPAGRVSSWTGPAG